MTTGYLIGLGFTLLWCGAVLIYWRWRLNRQSREWAAQRERDMADYQDRFEAKRREWEEQDATAEAEHAAVIAEVNASIERANQFWIKRGLEPTPPPPPEPSESSP
jgi:hypothetical protein